MKKVFALIVALIAAVMPGRAEIGDKIELDDLCYEIVEVECYYPNEPPNLWMLTENITGAKICGVTYIPENGVVNAPSTISINGESYDVAFIGESLFEGRTDLKEFNFSPTQCVINKKAFKDCGDIKLNISGVIRYIDGYAFSGTNVVNGLDLSKAMILDNFALYGTKTKSCTFGSYLWHLTSHNFDNSDIEEISFVDNECRYEPDVRGALFYTHVFYDSKIREVRFPNRQISLGAVAFAKCMNLERVIFPNFPKIWPLGGTEPRESDTPVFPFSYDGYIISECPNLKEVVSLNARPTLFYLQNVLVSDVKIIDDYSSCVLKVPAGSEDAYRADPVWGQFKHIEGFQPGEYTDIEGVATDAPSDLQSALKLAVGHNGLTQQLPEGNVEIYNPTGTKVLSAYHPGGTFRANLPQGIYIVHLR